MSDATLEAIFRTQAARLWQSFSAAWDAFAQASAVASDPVAGPDHDTAPGRPSAAASALAALRLPLHTLKGSALGLERLPLAQACHDLESALAAWCEAPGAEARAALVVAESALRPQWLAAAAPQDDAVAKSAARTAGAVDAVVPAGVRGGAADLLALHEAVAGFVRRTSVQCGVPANCEVRLAPRWLDEQALLWDTLPHLVRNAFSHGGEPVARRQALGKPEALRIRVRGRASDTALRLLVADDGAGVASPRAEADLWAGRGQGVPAVRASLDARASGAGRVSLRWRGRAGHGAVARACIFFF